MISLTARRLMSACIPAAVVFAALLAPGAASAELGAQCSGVSVTGQGSSLQALAEEVWTKEFNVSTDKSACNKPGAPTVKYTSTGSGTALKSWGVGKVEHNFGASNAFASTDEPVNAGQKAEIETFETKVVTSPVETVPVLQGAVAIVVNLPSNCVATSSSNKGRLVLNNATLEGIFRGTIKKWSEISDGGDTLSGTGCVATTAIQPVVRFDGSGTTHIFKKYLGLIGKTSFETEKSETKNWDQISEGPENTTWPKAAGVIKPAAKGGSELIKLVAATPGSIGYANLADARNNASFVPPAGGPKKATFWAPLQNGAATYADPATNKDIAKKASANCAKTEYTNGEGKAFPPASVFETWNTVTTSTEEPKYTLCGLTYVTTLDAYGAFENGTGTSLGEATTVNNFLRFVTDPGSTSGQAVIKNHDYLAITGTVLKEAQKGAAAVGF